MLEYSARISSQDDLARDLQHLSDTLGTKVSTEDLETSVSNMLEVANKIQAQVCNLSVFGISDSGYVDIKKRDACPAYSVDSGGDFSGDSPFEYQKTQLRLTLRSDYDALQQRVYALQKQIAAIADSNKITPITDNSLRIYGSTLYPKYGDWLLTSDASTQYLSFSGLSAEVGRSIYIQTRKKVYLYATGFSFFGLPGDPSKGTAVNQWLSNNTTFRFVRANATAWLVTASSSPYPWT